ncbi:benzoate/H(+) symporter BenE family transporter [Terasakiella sp.]|uniref:benzoate/H(+) symporter BenE family transporter n=1 Tax=Terasakiella sp. TaxID=2034861 RepID=UPI003AA874E5
MRFPFSFSHITAGFVAVLIGYTSAAALVFEAARAGGAGPLEAGSWMWALGLGMGISGIGLSIYYKTPVMIAWSTPGAALLITSLPGVDPSYAVGAFLFSSALITLCGITGWVDRLMALIPTSLATAMLAGVLLRFGLSIFPAFADSHILVGAMVATYLLGKWRASRYTIPFTFAVGVIVAVLQQDVILSDLDVQWTIPVFTMPSFDLSTWIGVGLPLFIVTMASQNLPGLAVLRAHNYHIAASPLIGWSGVMGLIFAPFGGYAFNLAAITAALCMGDDVDKDPARRYWATVWAGIFYMLAGVVGVSVAGLFAAFPAPMIATIAGLALLGTIANSLSTSLSEASTRDSAILCFVITASGAQFLTIGAPFWGLVVGLLAYHGIEKKRA